MIKKLSFKINELVFDIRYRENSLKKPIVIFFHGFKSFRNWGFIPYICEKLAENDAIAINLDFSMNGIIAENPVIFSIDKFAQNTVSQELADARELIKLLRLNNINEDLNQVLKNWNDEIILMGHSRGAGIALILANEMKINKLILLATISTFDRYTERLKQEWLSKGFLEFQDAMSKQVLRMNSTYLIDLTNNKKKFDLYEIASKIEIPVLFIHGENDITERPEKAKEIYYLIENNQKSNCNFVLLKKANHLFNVTHPFEKTNIFLEEALNNIKRF
jgi:pimeloyl-ACP methyl ester carboxylesterase